MNIWKRVEEVPKYVKILYRDFPKTIYSLRIQIYVYSFLEPFPRSIYIMYDYLIWNLPIWRNLQNNNTSEVSRPPKDIWVLLFTIPTSTATVFFIYRERYLCRFVIVLNYIPLIFFDLTIQVEILVLKLQFKHISVWGLVYVQCPTWYWSIFSCYSGFSFYPLFC